MPKKLNILMATEAFYPDGIGGAHTYVYNLSKYLIRQGHRVYVITIKNGESALADEDIEGIKVLRYKTPISGLFLFVRRPICSIINSRRLFCSIAKEVKFDVINFHLALPAFGLSTCSFSKGIPKIYTFHSSMAGDVAVQVKKKKYFPSFLNSLVFAVIRSIEKADLKWCDKVIVLSGFSKRCLTEIYKQDPGKITIIPGGVDVNKFIPVIDKMLLRKELSIPADKTVLLTARRLVARMGLENLIYAMRHVIEKEKNVILLILGEGFLREKLELIITQNGLKDYVILLGPVDTGKMSSYYQACDAFVLPTEQDEWFGLVTIEALSCGIPVLGTPVGGTSEILGSIDKALLFSGTGARDMAKGILDFLGNKDRFTGKSREFRKFAEDNYSWEIVSRKTEDIYLSILGK
ncbi:MAG: glycosyltransferase family 4 protein [Candidatus Omnitrophica bacterium]|nr:glycosyltransferase family 4 protein [Candidatus Omnitrophota bacterium]